MKTERMVFISVLILLVLSLAGCQSTVETTLPPPAEVPPTKTPVPASATPAPTDTPVPAPTEVPMEIPTSTPTTIPAEPERPVGSIDELIGIWKGYWSDRTIIFLEFKVDKQSEQTMSHGEFAGSEWYDFKDEMLTWGKMIKPMNAAPICIENPEASYEVYIITRGDKPEELRFVLVGEDQCVDRKAYLDGNSLTWVGTEMP